MTQGFDHGPRLTPEEYEKRVVALRAGLPPVPSKEQEATVRRAELDLAIDHRLGRDFPRDRREALWACRQRVERHRLRLVLKYLLKRLLSRSLHRDAQSLAAHLVDEYATVLTRAELEAFLGRDEIRHPMLPVDPERG